MSSGPRRTRPVPEAPADDLPRAVHFSVFDSESEGQILARSEFRKPFSIEGHEVKGANGAAPVVQDLAVHAGLTKSFPVL